MAILPSPPFSHLTPGLHLGQVVARTYRLEEVEEVREAGVVYLARHLVRPEPYRVYLLEEGVERRRLRVEGLFCEAALRRENRRSGRTNFLQSGQDERSHCYFYAWPAAAPVPDPVTLPPMALPGPTAATLPLSAALVREAEAEAARRATVQAQAEAAAQAEREASRRAAQAHQVRIADEIAEAPRASVRTSTAPMRLEGVPTLTFLAGPLGNDEEDDTLQVTLQLHAGPLDAGPATELEPRDEAGEVSSDEQSLSGLSCDIDVLEAFPEDADLRGPAELDDDEELLDDSGLSVTTRTSSALVRWSARETSASWVAPAVRRGGLAPVDDDGWEDDLDDFHRRVAEAALSARREQD